MGQSTSRTSSIVEPRFERPVQTLSHDEPLIASILVDIDPQSYSLLYMLIPAEIREMIFKHYMLTTLSSPQNSFPKPKTTSPTKKTTTTSPLALLLTSRLTYLETHHLPILLTPHTFYRPSLIGPPGIHKPSIAQYINQFHPQQLQFLTSIEIVTHQLFLEDGSFTKICKLDGLKGLRKLGLTVRYCDWWGWEGRERVEIRAWGTRAREEGCNFTNVEKGVRKVSYEGVLEEHAWEYSFRHLKALEELEVRLEMSEDRIEELDCVVDEMGKWEFPASGGRVLTSMGLRVRWRRGEGLGWKWSKVCGRCLGRGDDCMDCVKREIHRDAGLSPVVHSASLSWRVGGGR